MWGVVEFSSIGEFFDPNYFETKEKAIEFLKADSNECYGCNVNSHPSIEFSNDCTSACVAVENRKFFWRAFEVSNNKKVSGEFYVKYNSFHPHVAIALDSLSHRIDESDEIGLVNIRIIEDALWKYSKMFEWLKETSIVKALKDVKRTKEFSDILYEENNYNKGE